MINPLPHPTKAQMFLFQSQPLTDAIVTQVVIQAKLLQGQPMQIAPLRLVLLAPKGHVSIKRGPIHEKRIGVTKVLP